MTRRRKQDPKRNPVYLRLTDRQLELLQRYVDFKGYDSEQDAIRNMVDGLESWLTRQLAKRDIAGSAGPPPPTSVRTDVAPSDVARSDVARPNRDLDEDSPDPEVSDFGGRPVIGLPKPSWHDDSGD